MGGQDFVDLASDAKAKETEDQEDMVAVHQGGGRLNHGEGNLHGHGLIVFFTFFGRGVACLIFLGITDFGISLSDS